MNFLEVVALALAPVLAAAALIYWRDKWEKEPVRRLVFCFLGGMLSCIPIVIMELTADLIFNKPREAGIGGILVSAFIFVGLIEEFWKWVVVILLAYRSKDFNEPYDGITYSVMVSLGFAFVENVLYINAGGVPIAVLRMFTAIPAHTVFGIIMGFYLGLAKHRDRRRSLPFGLALLIPVLMHGAYDFALFVTNSAYAWIGAAVSLVLGIWFSVRAIRIHNQNSPFNKEEV